MADRAAPRARRVTGLGLNLVSFLLVSFISCSEFLVGLELFFRQNSRKKKGNGMKRNPKPVFLVHHILAEYEMSPQFQFPPFPKGERWPFGSWSGERLGLAGYRET